MADYVKETRKACELCQLDKEAGGRFGNAKCARCYRGAPRLVGGFQSGTEIFSEKADRDVRAVKARAKAGNMSEEQKQNELLEVMDAYRKSIEGSLETLANIATLLTPFLRTKTPAAMEVLRELEILHKQLSECKIMPLVDENPACAALLSSDYRRQNGIALKR